MGFAQLVIGPAGSGKVISSISAIFELTYLSLFTSISTCETVWRNLWI